ncbi:MAG: hypothetical protein KDA28_02015, partial [Phycisphaerales bacterium]|nr:hypothetical protein [Phycisphaerales bacterium]
MNKVVAFVKRRLVIVICLVVVVASLPAAWFFSSGWTKGQLDKRQKDAQAKLDEVKRSKVTYVVPSYDPSVESVSLTVAPNEKLTAYFKAERDRIDADSKRVIDEVLAFNQRDHGVLLEGVLPDGASSRNLTRLEAMFVAEGDQPTVLDALLERVNAGTPIADSELERSLNDLNARMLEKLETDHGRAAVTPDMRKSVTQELVKTRLGAYKSRSTEISVYADRSVLLPPNVDQQGETVFPTQKGTTTPHVAEAFSWQFAYWV